MLGTMVAERNLQAAFRGVDGVGVVVATALLALRFFRTGNDVVAAGFLVFSIGESVMLAGTAESLAGSVPSFAAGPAYGCPP
jgi:predicted phage tail protein